MTVHLNGQPQTGALSQQLNTVSSIYSIGDNEGRYPFLGLIVDSPRLVSPLPARSGGGKEYDY